MACAPLSLSPNARLQSHGGGSRKRRYGLHEGRMTGGARACPPRQGKPLQAGGDLPRLERIII
jgi:hypothetical protein